MPPPASLHRDVKFGRLSLWYAQAGSGAQVVVRKLSAALERDWRLCILLPTLLISLGFTAYIALSHKLFWDFAVYQSGLAAYRAVGTPYDPAYLHRVFALDLPFTYPPLVLLAFSRVSWLFDSPLGLALLLILHLSACVSIPYLVTPRHLRRTELPWMVGVYLVAFGLSGTKILLTGNIAAIICAPVLAALTYSASRKNYALLWLVLLLACQVKIYFICFAAIPLLVDRKVFEPSIACLLIIASYALNFLAPPLLLNGFLTTLASASHTTGFVGTSVLTAVQVTQDRIGIAHSLAATTLAWGVHCAYALSLLGFGIAVMWSRHRPREPWLAFLWALVAALLISPRLAPYELALLVIPFLILLRILLTKGGLGLGIAVAAFVLAASLGTTPLADWGGLLVVLGVWMGVGCNWVRHVAAPA
jgi:hypothetical protein